MKRIFKILNSENAKTQVSINGGEDFLSSLWDTVRVHWIHFDTDESVIDLFNMALGFEHLIFEECKFSNQFTLAAKRVQGNRLKKVSFIGP